MMLTSTLTDIGILDAGIVALLGYAVVWSRFLKHFCRTSASFIPA